MRYRTRMVPLNSHDMFAPVSRCLAIAIVSAGLLMTPAGHAAELTGTSPSLNLQRSMSFAIAAQPLADALDAFSRTTEVQILYDSSLASGQRSTPIQGTWPIETALRMLLQGTGLLVHYTAHHDIVLTAISNGNDTNTASLAPLSGSTMLSLQTLHVYPPSTDLGTPSTSDVPYRLYGGIMQAKIEEALRHDKSTSHGTYSLRLAIWVSASGKLLRHSLLQSTGDSARDRNVDEVIRDLNFGQSPPANIPQPIRIGVQVRAP